jgi:hypothetical protein
MQKYSKVSRVKDRVMKENILDIPEAELIPSSWKQDYLLKIRS